MRRREEEKKKGRAIPSRALFEVLFTVRAEVSPVVLLHLSHTPLGWAREVPRVLWCHLVCLPRAPHESHDSIISLKMYFYKKEEEKGRRGKKKEVGCCLLIPFPL